MNSRFRSLTWVALLVIAAGTVSSCGSDRTKKIQLDAPAFAVSQPLKLNAYGQRTPNILAITLDDVRDDMMNHLPVLTSRSTNGLVFSNAVVHSPECCPSRATFFTGEHMQHHNVLSGASPTGGQKKLDESKTIAVALQAGGYYTVQIGKYLNGYGMQSRPTYVPKGWSRWMASVDPNTYYAYGWEFNIDGAIVDAPLDHNTHQDDQIATMTVDELTKLSKQTRPWFVNLNFVSPHNTKDEYGFSGKPVAPARYSQIVDGNLPVTPGIEDDLSDKPVGVQDVGAVADLFDRRTPDVIYKAEIGAYASINASLGKVFETLEQTGQLQNTVVVVWSDNGLQRGEHGQTEGKGVPYNDSVRTPLYIWGPEIPKGEIEPIVSSVDLAPTIVQLAGLPRLPWFDGISLIDVAAHPPAYLDRTVLVELGELFDRDFWRSARSRTWEYTEWSTGETELYDLVNDPNELTNLLAVDPKKYRSQELQMKKVLDFLHSCTGIACVTPPPQPEAMP